MSCKCQHCFFVNCVDDNKVVVADFHVQILILFYLCCKDVILEFMLFQLVDVFVGVVAAAVFYV